MTKWLRRLLHIKPDEVVEKKQTYHGWAKQHMTNKGATGDDKGPVIDLFPIPPFHLSKEGPGIPIDCSSLMTKQGNMTNKTWDHG